MLLCLLGHSASRNSGEQTKIRPELERYLGRAFPIMNLSESNLMGSIVAERQRGLKGRDDLGVRDIKGKK